MMIWDEVQITAMSVLHYMPVVGELAGGTLWNSSSKALTADCSAQAEVELCARVCVCACLFLKYFYS